jgi:hypothetical protein
MRVGLQQAPVRQGRHIRRGQGVDDPVGAGGGEVVARAGQRAQISPAEDVGEDLDVHPMPPRCRSSNTRHRRESRR